MTQRVHIMTKEDIVNIIREEIKSFFQEMQNTNEKPSHEELDERTVASREPPRKMSKDQVKSRDGIGKKLLKNKRSVKYFKNKFGQDWKSYLWAASTNRSLGGKSKQK